MTRGARVFRFGDFELDEGRLELRCAKQLIELEPKPLRLLLYLVEQRDRVVHKDSLLEAVWRGEVVGDAALAGALRDVRRALGDDGAEQRWIRTRRRVGYQFIGSVEEVGAPDAPQPQPPQRRGLYGIPRGLSMAFVSREDELHQLESMLTQETYAGVQVSIEGLAGIGKTELALQLVHKLAHEQAFPGGIYWLEAETTDLRPAWATTIAERHGIAAGPLEQRCTELVRRLQESREPVLVVLDNVESWAPGARPAPLPSGPHVRLLVTTRIRNLAGAQFRHVGLGLLAPPHDRELVLRFAGREPDSGLDELLEHLGGHPLALALAGAFLGSYPGETATSYLEELRRNPEAVEGGVTDRVRYERTVTHAFRTVWDRLSPEAREAWWLASFFETEPVTRELAIACGVGRSALRRLEELHLIQSGSDGRWTMHRLTRDFGQRATPPARRALELLLAMGPPLMNRNHAALELRRVYQGAVAFAEQTEEHEQVFFALDGLWHTSSLHGDWQKIDEIAGGIEQLAGRHDSSLYWLSAYRARGTTCLYTGKIGEACSWLEKGIALYSSGDFGPFRSMLHPGVFLLTHAGYARCLAGFPDQGLQLAQQSGLLAQEFPVPSSFALSALGKALLYWFRTDVENVERHATELLDVIASTRALPVFRSLGALLVSWARIARNAGSSSREIGAMREDLAKMVELNLWLLRPFCLGLLADACARLGRTQEGLSAVDEALQLVHTAGDRFFEPELWRIRATLAESPRESRQHIERAVRIAGAQGSRWFELRAATDWMREADTSELRAQGEETLKRCFSGFNEGFELFDMQRARAMLGPVIL